ncbi:MAG: ATP-binding protein, partial [Ketobacteraceae bacterium]|nr:ATP-binding protein [Ketobacteraceae bacterium]
IAGYVMATQTEKAWLSFTNQALRRVMNLSLLSFVVLVLILLGYAAWLSLRIKRLKQQAEAAIHPDGTIVPFAPGTAPDELGALSQSYTDLLTRVKNYNEYLQSLTHKLAHEIRTPLAIVKSSLEMLGSVEGEAQKTYIERALSGNQRLANILNAMSESTQVEQLVQYAEFHTMDPEPLLHDMVNAYTSTYPDFRFRLECTGAPASIRGNPELIAQLLDKLVDNARDFTPVEETITITLNRTPHQVRLSVSNPGSRLPDTMHDQLFDSLISVRDNAARDEGEHTGTHLGLGLYIVRLIAQAHQGQVAAFNLPGNRGVCFQVTLPHAGADPT